MKKLEQDQIKNVVALRKQGKSYKKIARALSLSPATIYKYAKNITLNDEAFDKINKNILKNQSRFIKSYSTEKFVKKPRVSLSLIRIISHCIFDGCVINSKENGNYVIKYTNSSKKEVEKFINDFKYVFKIKPQSFDYIKGKDIDYYECVFISKRVVNILKTYVDNYSTSSNKCSIHKLFNILKNASYKNNFLRCFWCDEGCVDIKDKIYGKSKSIKIIKQLKKLHSSLKIETSIWKDNLSNNYALYIKKSKDNFNKFSDIGFGYGVITRGRNLGLEKQYVFNDVLRRYQ